MPNVNLEQTLALIKPDALKNSLTGYVLSQLSEVHSGLRFSGVKVVNVSRMLAEEHYAEHRGKVFYPDLLQYIMGELHYADRPHRRRVIAIVYQGEDAVNRLRQIVGPTNPHKAREEKPGCVRSLGTIVPIKNSKGEVVAERMDNLIHASATSLEAEREIKLWFRPDDIPPSMQSYPTRRFEEHYYYQDGELFTQYASGRVCILAPGDIVWESDAAALDAINRGATGSDTLNAVVAKYLINRG